MQFHGLQKTTLLDYPNHVAATIFIGGCNFRCPFCHNGDLVLHPEQMPVISEDEILSFLEKRKGVLDGVCITGGEPTLQAGLEAFLRKVKAMGYDVKLDTNGSRPGALVALYEMGLLDYVAMDIKHAPDKYNSICQMSSFELSIIETSIEFLMHGSIPYEFRTTLVKELHNEADIISIGKWLKGARNYYLQSYQDADAVIQKGFHALDKDTLLHFQELLTPYIENVALRGID